MCEVSVIVWRHLETDLNPNCTLDTVKEQLLSFNRIIMCLEYTSIIIRDTTLQF